MRLAIKLYVLTCVLLLTMATPSFAQGSEAPRVPPEFLERVRRLEGDTLTVCVNSESLLAEFEKDVVVAIADALLLDIELIEVRGVRAPPVLDYSFAMNESELFLLLNNTCQAMTGFLMSSSNFASWLTITRPYVEFGFVFATTQPGVESLAEVAPGSRVGTKMASTADLAFIDQVNSLPQQQQWKRVPYPNNRYLIDRLLEGELDVILIWEPGLTVGVGSVPGAADMRVIAPNPVRLPTQRFGIVMLERDSFLRSAIDTAIGSVVDDGTIARLLTEHGIPGSAGR